MSTPEPTRDDVDKMPGDVLLEFGASWCGHCQAAQPAITSWLRRHPQVQHIKIEDGPGKPLGRSFRVKLWPTLVLMHDGSVAAQLVRPAAEEIEKELG
ncbi:MAG TPA: thioredoxin family protein [Pirellulales bacterium]|nr:thioredoxin family protein [Pirellulales bacterium]